MANQIGSDEGQRETMNWGVAVTSFGPMLVAATRQGVCRLGFGISGGQLAAQFPGANCVAGGRQFSALLADVVAAVEDPAADNEHIPLDLRGTDFQLAVWRALRAIPIGQTRTYAAIAAALGKPGAARAVGGANAANPVAILVPCHRIVTSGGGIGGYAWGSAIKAELLRREGAVAPLLL